MNNKIITWTLTENETLFRTKLNKAITTLWKRISLLVKRVVALENSKLTYDSDLNVVVWENE